MAPVGNRGLSRGARELRAGVDATVASMPAYGWPTPPELPQAARAARIAPGIA